MISQIENFFNKYDSYHHISNLIMAYIQNCKLLQYALCIYSSNFKSRQHIQHKHDSNFSCSVRRIILQDFKELKEATIFLYLLSLLVIISRANVSFLCIRRFQIAITSNVYVIDCVKG